MNENWQQVKKIFADVLGLPPQDRSHFIDLHCSGNEDLRREVESLLSSYNSAEQFLESPAIGEIADKFINDGREFKTGEFLNHYKIIEKLGKGGMGAVYLAEDTKLERQVAIKVLSNSFYDGETNLKRFFQEAKAASALNHPNIIVVHEIGECDGTHYIVIEFVKGQTLNEAIKRKKLTFLQIIDSSIQIVKALEAAHSVGIIHRDIKPDNIMLRDDRIVKVLDFGLAKLTEKNKTEADFEAQTRELFNTGAGMILGTAAYMSPEQTRGSSVDTRSDVWSFGVVLFQMLTGRLPFPGETTSDIIASILKTEPPHLSEFVSNVPIELDRIVRKTLRKNPDARYQTASELLDDLMHFRREFEFGEGLEPKSTRISEDFKPGQTTDAEFVAVTAGQSRHYSEKLGSFISEAVSRARTRPKVAFLGIAALVAVVAAGIFGLSKLISSAGASDSFQNMRLTKVTYDANATNVIAVSPDGKYVVYALRDEGKQTLMVRQIATSSVVSIVPPAEVFYDGLTFTPDGNYIYYTVSHGNNAGTLYEIPVLGGSSRKVAEEVDGKVTTSPTGDTIAFIRSRTSLMLADSKGNSQRLLAASAPGEFWALAEWNPIGKSIICSVFSSADSSYHLAEVSVENGSEKVISSVSWQNINGLAWLSDGNGVLLSGRDPETKFSQIWLVSYPSGETRRITNDFSTYVGLGLTADNKSLVAVKQERLFNIWVSRDGNAESAKKITFEEGKDEGTSGIAWTPDGRIVYTVRTTSTVDIWIANADGSNNHPLTRDDGSNFSPVVSPDGRFIVFTSSRTGNQDLWRMDLDGGNPIVITDTPDDEGNPSFTPDGRWILYERTDANNLATIWKVSIDGGAPVQLTETESSRPTVSPDGKVFACAYGVEKSSERVKLAIVPIGGSTPLKILDLPLVVKSRTFRWSSDGKKLIYVDSLSRTHNLWSQTLDSSPPKQITFFESGQIARFSFDREGKGFVLSRGSESSDVVMVSNFR